MCKVFVDLVSDSIVTSNAAESYKAVDVVVLISILEEESGFAFSETVVSYIIRLRQIVSVTQILVPQELAESQQRFPSLNFLTLPYLKFGITLFM